MKAAKYPLLGVTLAAMSSCALHPDLIATHIKEGGEAASVEVTLRSSDAKVIKDREIYFSIVLVDCENSRRQFPIQPYVAERPASEFDFSVAGKYVTFHGSVPQHILANYPRPCVFLRGGSYTLGKIESASVRLGKSQI